MSGFFATVAFLLILVHVLTVPISLVWKLGNYLAVIAFLGIVAWAWGSGRRKEFDEAANAPFALPDDDALAEQRAMLEPVQFLA